MLLVVSVFKSSTSLLPPLSLSLSLSRSYKGSHLALMVELLAGALPGAAMEDKRNAKGWGTLIIAIDPEEFDSLEAFQARVRVMCQRVTGKNGCVCVMFIVNIYQDVSRYLF